MQRLLPCLGLAAVALAVPSSLLSQQKSLKELEKEIEQMEAKQRAQDQDEEYSTKSFDAEQKSPAEKPPAAESFPLDEPESTYPTRELGLYPTREYGFRAGVATLMILVGGVWFVVALVMRRSFWKVVLQTLGMTVFAILVAWAMDGNMPVWLYLFLVNIPVLIFLKNHPERLTITPVALQVVGYVLMPF